MRVRAAIATADRRALPTGISVETTLNIFHDIYASFERVQQRRAVEMQSEIMSQDLNL